MDLCNALALREGVFLAYPLGSATSANDLLPLYAKKAPRMRGLKQFVAFVKLHVFAGAGFADAVVLAVVYPACVTLRGKHFLAELLGVCNRREVSDADAVERAFEFARIFDFGDIGFNSLVRELADNSVCSLSRRLDAHLNHVLARRFLLDARLRRREFFAGVGAGAGFSSGSFKDWIGTKSGSS